MRPVIGRVMRAGIGIATSGGSQDFLDAPWVNAVLRHTPPRRREQVALFVLSLSPHYFYDKDRRAEAARNRSSRELLVEEVLQPFLDPSALVLDYGCGPGYMAAAVARRVRAVEAVDVSRGVLGCAQVLNGAPNIIYETPQEALKRREPVDAAYSFAVIQHLTGMALHEALSLLRRRVRPGGTLLLHFAVPDGHWRTEDEWRSDTSVKGRARLRFGLHCFGRQDTELCRLVTESGFRNAEARPLEGLTSVNDDIARQSLLIATG